MTCLLRYLYSLSILLLFHSVSSSLSLSLSFSPSLSISSMAVGLKSFFSIRQYTATIRSVDLEKCWPFSEAEKNKSLPRMAWRSHRWWSSELKNVGSTLQKEGDVSLELKDVDEEELDDEGVGAGIEMFRTPKKRSIVELFAIAPKIAGGGEEVEEEEEDEEEGDKERQREEEVIEDVKRRKRKKTKEESVKVLIQNKKKTKRKRKKMQKWGEIDEKMIKVKFKKRGKLTSTSTRPEKDKKNKGGIHHLKNDNKVKLMNKIDLDVSKLILGSVLKRCSGSEKRKGGTMKTTLPKQKKQNTGLPKKQHGKSRKDHVPGILKTRECVVINSVNEDKQSNILQNSTVDITKHHLVQQQHIPIKRASFSGKDDILGCEKGSCTVVVSDATLSSESTDREPEPPVSEDPTHNNINVVVDDDDKGIPSSSTTGTDEVGNHEKRQEIHRKSAFSYSLDLNHSLMPSCSESESLEPCDLEMSTSDQICLGGLHRISNQVERGTTSPSKHKNHTFRRQLPASCVSVSRSSAMISESWESSEDRLWKSVRDGDYGHSSLQPLDSRNHRAFNPNQIFQFPHTSDHLLLNTQHTSSSSLLSNKPLSLRDAESVNPSVGSDISSLIYRQHGYTNRDLFSGLPLNSQGELIEPQPGPSTVQNYMKPTNNLENQKMKEQSLFKGQPSYYTNKTSARNFPEISVLDMNVRCHEQPQNEYDHHHHAYQLRPGHPGQNNHDGFQMIAAKESSGSSNRPTMRLMGKNVTVGKTLQEFHGSEDGKVWTDKEIIAEQKQNVTCSSCFSGGVGRSSLLNMDRHLGIEEAQPPPMIGNYFYNSNRLQQPPENHFSAMNLYSSHGSSSSSHRYHHHHNQNLTGRTPSSVISHAFLNMDYGRSRLRHEFPTQSLQQWLMDTAQNFAPPYHGQFSGQYHHHPRTTSGAHNLHPFPTPYFPPPPPPPNIPMTSFPVMKPDSVTDDGRHLDNWKHRLSRNTRLEEQDRNRDRNIKKRPSLSPVDLTNPAKKKPNSLVMVCHDDEVVVEEEEDMIISAGPELNGWTQRVDNKDIDVGNNALSNDSSSRFGGPIKLSAGAKHILKPSQKKMDSDNTRLTYSTRPFALMNEAAPPTRPPPAAMKKSARIYQF